MLVDVKLVHDLKKADLYYVDDTQKGITREKNGKRFKYFDTDKKVIKSNLIIKRIERLAIPPAWENVWICPSPNGYLQAVGFDEKGRKQYIYHPEWVKISQENKFNKMVFFGEVLPTIRQEINKDMIIEDLNRDKIIATVIWLLEHTLIRIGNDEYALQNNSYGLTTLRNRHVSVRGKNIKFEFRGKSGVQTSISIAHPRIAKIIKECIELPGYEIFQFLDDNGERHTVNSADINNYLKKVTGDDVTAKEFRTWGGTVLCASSLNQIGPSETESDEKKKITRVVKKVSEHLHNTVAVCRSYYIHPAVIETYQKNNLIKHFEDTYKEFNHEKAKINREEFATLTLLKKYS